MNVVERAIEAHGLQALADTMKVKYQAIQKWRRKGKVPAERVLALEAATGGTIDRTEIRPDLYPPTARKRA